MATISLNDIRFVCNLTTSDWEVVKMSMSEIKRTSYQEGEKQSLWARKRDKYAELLKKGVELPAIIIDKDNQIVDGQCRYAAYKLLRRRKILCIREVTGGRGILRWQ